MKTTARLLLFGLLWTISSPLETLATARGPAHDQPTSENRQTSKGRARWSDEERNLLERLAASNETPIKFHNDPLAPLVIKEASVKYIAIESPATAAVSEPRSRFDSYAASLRIGLKNPSSAELQGLIFEIRNDATTFRLRRNVTIAPGKEDTIGFDLIYLPCQPSSLVVTLAGAGMPAGIVWGDFPRDQPVSPPSRGPAGSVPYPSPEAAAQLSPERPLSPLPPKPPFSAQASPGTTTQKSPPEEAVPVVDTRPIMINRPRPNYTEAARRNGVNGSAVLRLLVGSDGGVQQVKTVRPLPDFLTEEAIRCSFEIRFKPAMKSGQPVAYWMTVEMEFNLR